MTEFIDGMDSAVRELAELLDGLTSRGKATIFGVCGRALAPLTGLIERQSNGRWSFPDLDLALDSIKDFATGTAEAADYSQLRAKLMDAVPHGDDLGLPWGAYVENALICADAGLAAASIDADARSIWIQYALDPIIVSLQLRDMDIIKSRGDVYWRKRIVADPMVSLALSFLRHSIGRLSGIDSIDELQFNILVEQAIILRPVDTL